MFILGKRKYKKKLTRLRDSSFELRDEMIKKANKAPNTSESIDQWLKAAFHDGQGNAYDNMLFDLDVWGS